MTAATGVAALVTAQLTIGNIGTGNISTLATFQHFPLPRRHSGDVGSGPQRNLTIAETPDDLAKDELLVAKQKIGGQIVFVEMEHGNEQLAKFYADNGFVLFGSRNDVEDGKPITYDQLFLFLK